MKKFLLGCALGGALVLAIASKSYYEQVRIVKAQDLLISILEEIVSIQEENQLLRERIIELSY